MNACRYLSVVACLTLVLLGSIVAVNAGIDPYGLRANVELADDRGPDTIERPGSFWRKALSVREIMPRTVILGTSRAETGLDIHHPGFSPYDTPVLNLALGAVQIEQMRLLLIHAHTVSKVRKAVIGLDLEAFLGAGRADFVPAGLSGNADSEPAWLVRLKINLSRDVLGSAMTHVGPLAVAIPKPSLEARIKELEGQRGVVWITEFNNFYSRLADLFPRSATAESWSADARRHASMQSFSGLLAYAHQHGIDLRLFISPVHARYLEWYRRVGWWPLFQDWKRELVKAIAVEGQSHPSKKEYALWDFSGFHPLATEPVPRLRDLETRMRWYLESSHYTPALGNLVLERILADRPVNSSPLPDSRIDHANIEGHLLKLSLDADQFRAAQPWEAANVREMVAYLRRIARK